MSKENTTSDFFTDWTYAPAPESTDHIKLNKQYDLFINGKFVKPNSKKSYRVKGKIDNHPIKTVALTPIGEGNFILAVNAEIRKAIKKIHGVSVQIYLEEDAGEFVLNEELVVCLNDEPAALKYFKSLPPSHQNWFSNWVKSAKTQPTVTKRIAVIVNACIQKMSFSAMMKNYRDDKKFIQ